MLDEYLDGLQYTETNLRLLAMLDAGVFKTKDVIFDIDSENLNQFADRIDIKKYKEIDKLTLGPLVKRLQERGIVGPQYYQVLLGVIKRRNRLHRLKRRWTEQDRTVFAWSANAAYSLFIGRQDANAPKDFAVQMYESVETDARKLIDAIASPRN